MTSKQVLALREKINAAYHSGNKAEAARLQEKLHAHFVADSDRWLASKEGQAHIERMATA